VIWCVKNKALTIAIRIYVSDANNAIDMPGDDVTTEFIAGLQRTLEVNADTWTPALEVRL